MRNRLMSNLAKLTRRQTGKNITFVRWHEMPGADCIEQKSAAGSSGPSTTLPGRRLRHCFGDGAQAGTQDFFIIL